MYRASREQCEAQGREKLTFGCFEVLATYVVFDKSCDNFGDDGPSCYCLRSPTWSSSWIVKFGGYLQSQLQEARGQVDSGYTGPTSPNGTPEEEPDRLEVVHVGAKVVREDIYASKSLCNARHGTTYTDDIHYEIVPVSWYMQSLAPTLLELMKHAFRIEIDTCPPYRQGVGHPMSRWSPVRPWMRTRRRALKTRVTS